MQNSFIGKICDGLENENGEGLQGDDKITIFLHPAATTSRASLAAFDFGEKEES